MVEFRELESQDRFDWYRVNKLLHEVGIASESHGLKSKDIVHLGGTAIFYRAYQAFGSIAVSHFRGTHDMDIVCFTQGSIQRILDTLKATPSSSVANYYLGKSASLPNKKSIYVNLDKGLDLGASTGFEIDVYESEKGVIK